MSAILNDTKLERHLRISGVLIILGLVIELISLKWAHPTAFLLFVMVGGLLMIAGMFYYLFSLVTIEKLVKKPVSEEAPKSLPELSV